MSELELTEQLDQAIEAMLRGADAPRKLDAQIADLFSVAAELRNLPRAEFRHRLRAELEEEAAVSTGTKQTAVNVSRVREGFRTITPYLVVSDVHAEAEFLRQTFGVTGVIHGLGSQGGFHAEYNIGGSMLMVGGGGEGSQWKGTPLPGAIHLYVEDVDDVYQTAVQAGATSLMAPADMPYGERGAAVQDVGGNHWYLATAFGDNYVPSAVPNLLPFFTPRGAPQMIEFFKEAFAAEELSVHRSPKGRVLHAEIKIGDSIVEMGEAHEQWQPRPMVFMMYVDDVDAWYARAVSAKGAVAKDEPKLQPHGARMGSIVDPFDNVWYIASQVQTTEAEPAQTERK